MIRFSLVQWGFEHQESKAMSACFSTFTSSIFFWLYRQWLNFQPGRSETATCVTWKARASQYLVSPTSSLVQSVFWVNTCTHTHSKGSHPTVLQWPRKAKGWLCTHSWAVHHRGGNWGSAHPELCQEPQAPLSAPNHWEGTATCQHPDLTSQTIWWAPSNPTSPLLDCGAQREKKNYTGTWMDSVTPVKNL